MLRESTIVALAVIGLKKECFLMIKCQSVEFVTPIVTFDDLQKPIIIDALFLKEDRTGYKQRYECIIHEDGETDKPSISLAKLNPGLQ